MKTKYPNYKKIGTKSLRNDLKPKDKQILEDFLEYCGSSAGEKKLKIIEAKILQVKDIIEKPFGQITLKDLRSFLFILNHSDKSPGTQNDTKKTLKRFLRWKYEDWDKKFDGLRDIKLKDDVNHDKLNENSMLKGEEIEKLMRGAENLKYKTFLVLMYEVAARPEEILKLKFSDVDLENQTVKLYSAKTEKTRVNPIRDTTPHLRRLKQEYPYGTAQKEDYVFPSPEDRKQHITIQAVDFYFKKLSFRTLDRSLNLYLLRHTRLSPLIQELSPKAYESFAGHSLQVGMKYYGHLPAKKIKQEILDKAFHVEDLTLEEKADIKELKEEIKKLKVHYNLLQSFFDEADKNDGIIRLKKINK